MKYEYKSVPAYTFEIDVEDEEQGASNLDNVLNSMAKNGWEYVKDFSVRAGKSVVYMIFKRPVQ